MRAPSSDTGTRGFSSLLATLTGLVFVLVVGLLGTLALERVEERLRLQQVAALDTVVRSTEQALREVWLAGHLRDAHDWAADPVVLRAAASLLELPADQRLDSQALEDLRARLREPLARHDARGFFLIDLDGQTVASLRDANLQGLNLLAEAQPEVFARVLAGESVLSRPMPSDVPLTRPDGELEPDYPTMFVAVPIELDGELAAVLTVRLDPTRDFSRLTQAGRVGESGETYVVGRDGLLLTESRFTEQLAGLGLLEAGERSMLRVRVADPGRDLREEPLDGVPPSETPTEMVASVVASGSGSSTVAYRDYRGVPVLGAWIWSEALDMGVATEIDEAEALAPYHSIRTTLLVTLAGTSLVALGLGFLVVGVEWRAGRALRRARSYAEKLIDTANAMVVVADAEGEVVVFNGAAEAISGYRKEQLEGRHWFEVLVPRGRYPEVWAELGRLLHGGLPKNFANPILTRSGDERYVVWQNSELVEGDRVVGTVSFGIDITERRRAEQALAKHHEELEQLVADRTRELRRSNRALAEFAYVASHDLQAPLHTMRGFLELLRQAHGEDLAPKGRRWLELIDDGAGRMSALITSLLTYARVGQELQLGEVDLQKVAVGVVAQLRKRVAERDAHVEIGVLPRVRADATQIGRVVQNLIDNALKYGGEGVTVRVSASRAGGLWRVDVSDDGPGVSTADQARVFDVLARGERGVEEEGTGLGLPICQRIVEAHGGELWLESMPEGGATFSFTVPAAEESAAVSRRTLLVVDDDAAVLQASAQLLRLEGHEVRTARSVDQALGLLDADVGVAVLDVHLGPESGVELARQIRERHPGLPVLFLTGAALEGLAQVVEPPVAVLEKGRAPAVYSGAVARLIEEGGPAASPDP